MIYLNTIIYKGADMFSERIQFYCKHLKLDYIGKNYEAQTHKASVNQTTHKEFLADILGLEYDDGNQRSIQKRLRNARLGVFKPLAEFDWCWPTKIQKDTVAELMGLDFIKEQMNVILLGPSGMGKTMIAKNIAHQAALSGKTSLFVEASDLILDLEQQESARLLMQRLNRYIKPHVLVIDEVGYQSYASTKAADLLFQVITKRHEKTSTIISTNLTFQEWGGIFMNAPSLIPLIDRLTQKSEIILIEGDSYRRKEASTRKKNKLSESEKNDTSK